MKSLCIFPEMDHIGTAGLERRPSYGIELTACALCQETTLSVHPGVWPRPLHWHSQGSALGPGLLKDTAVGRGSQSPTDNGPGTSKQLAQEEGLA